MKKSVCLIFVLCLCISLCGCAKNSEISDSSTSYLVSALGFSQENGKLNILVETMVVNSEDPLAEKKRAILKGEGKNVNEALNNAQKTASRPLELSHSGAIIISENIDEKYLDNICDFCYSNKELTLSVLFVATENAETLLKTEPASTIAIGYEIISLIQQRTALDGTEYQNRFYEIESLRQKPINVIYLPLLDVSEDTFSANGVRVYKNDKYTFDLTNEQFFTLSVATDNQSKGKAVLNNKVFEIKDCYSKIVPKSTTEAQIKIDLKTNNSEYKKEIKSKILELFEFSKSENTDIFGIGNSYYNKNKKAWKKIKDNYYEIYKNLELTVKIK